MDRNFKLYRASAHVIEAAKYLRGVEKELHKQLLNIAEETLEKIEIDEQEVSKVEEYEKKIREKIKG